MGAVLLADDPLACRRVALKVMRPELASEPGGRQRFLREARLAAGLEHDHIVPIYQVAEAAVEGQGLVPYIAMPLLKGETLQARVEREPRLSVAEVLRIGREIAEGLSAAHEKGLVHRDIKPANVWLEARPGEPGSSSHGGGLAGSPRVKILDFGLAREVGGVEQITRARSLLGTPAFMSPEQVNGEALDARSDLFSLGAVLYQMATGQMAFHGPSLTAVLRAVGEDDPAPPDRLNPELPPELAELIVRLLAKDRESRPASARAVADELRAIEASLKAPWESATQVKQEGGRRKAGQGRARTFLRRFRSSLLAGALAGGALLVLAGLLGLWWLQRPRPPYVGSVDVRIWRGTGDAAEKFRLQDDGALPLQKGDKFRIEAQVEPPAYLYLFWIDTEGQVLPVYPWTPGKWTDRQRRERKLGTLSMPEEDPKGGYTLQGKREGMETLLLLARPTPLELSDAEVKGLFAGLKPQRPVQHRLSAVWFENGRVVERDEGRKSRHFDVVSDIDDPVLRMQGVLRQRLGPHAAFTTAVSFARLGE
jgi:tRNA A-37 threonylcarbamoyl transferase component Bud32